MLVKSSSSPSSKIARIGKLSGALVASAALLTTAVWAQMQGPPVQGQVEMDPEVQRELLEVREQLQQLEGRIQEIEQRAMERSELQAAQEQYIDRLKSVAIEATPEVKSKFDRQDALIEELEGSPELRKPAAERSEDFNQKLGEFQQLRNEINPVVQSVANQPEVQEEYSKFQEKVVEEMKEIDPEADQLLAQRDQLFSRYQQLASRIQ